MFEDSGRQWDMKQAGQTEHSGTAAGDETRSIQKGRVFKDSGRQWSKKEQSDKQTSCT